MTELTKKDDNAVGALAGLRRNITNTRQALPTSSTQPILKMGKDGLWIYGADNIDITEDALFAANPLDVKHGFVCWTNYAKEEKKKNKLLGEVYVGMSSPPLDPANLPEKLDDNGDVCEWKPAAVVQLVCVKGEDKGVQVVYKPSSLGGTNFVDRLLAAVGTQIDNGSSEVVPHLKLSSDSYIHSTYGKTYTPDFEIKGWSGLTSTVVTPTEEKTKRKSRVEPKPKAETGEPADDVDADIENDAPKEDAPKAEGRTRRRRRAS